MTADRKISFVAFWFEGLNSPKRIENALLALKRHGYTGVDWKNTCFDAAQDMTSQLKSARRIADDLGMATCAGVILGNMMDETRDQFFARLSSWIRSCAEAGIATVNTAPGGAPDTPESWSKLTDFLSRTMDVCDECGVDLALESVVGNIVHDYPTTQKMFSLYDHDRMRLTLDPSHYHLYQTDIPEAIKALGAKKIAHVHVKDAIGQAINGQLPPEWTFPILGEGNIDWNAFFAALDSIGYDGYMAIEFEAWKYMERVLNNDPVSAARLSMDSMNALLADYAALSVRKA